MNSAAANHTAVTRVYKLLLWSSIMELVRQSPLQLLGHSFLDALGDMRSTRFVHRVADPLSLRILSIGAGGIVNLSIYQHVTPESNRDV